MKRITIRITFGGEGTSDPPLLERAHQTLPSWEGTPDLPLLERAHQTLPSWGGHTRPSPPGEAHQTLPWERHTRGHTRPLGRAHQTLGEGTPDPPHSRQTAYSRGRCQAAPSPYQGSNFGQHPCTRNKLRGVYVDQHLP